MIHLKSAAYGLLVPRDGMVPAMKALIGFGLALVLLAQNPNTPVYPGAVATDNSLLVATNNADTTLSVALSNTSTTVYLNQWNRFVTPMAITIDTEAMYCSGHSLGIYTCQRGFDGTAAVSHSVGAAVHGYIIAWHHNQLAAEVKAVEAALGANLGNTLSLYPDTTNNVSTFFGACSAAVAAGKTLAVTKTWSGVASGTCNASLMFTGGIIRPASGQTVTLRVPQSCTAGGLDTSIAGSGSIRFSADPFGQGSNPVCFGAKGDGSTDDTAAMQAAITATQSGSSSTAKVVIPSGTYKITTGLVSTAEGANIGGEGSYGSTFISWAGSTSGYAVSMQGFHYTFHDIVIEDSGTGWTAGFDHEASQAEVDHILVDCMAHPGDAISIGNQLIGQADQVQFNKTMAYNCTSGRAVFMASANAGNNVAINFYSPTIADSWIGVLTGNQGVNIYGGEIDNNDVNFLFGGGQPSIISGVRSEGSKRILFEATGGSTTPLTMQSYFSASYNDMRPATTTSCTGSGSGNITLSVAGFTFGDYVAIAGAGSAGGTLHTLISNMTSPTTATISPVCTTTVSGAAVTLDSSVTQYQMFENDLGPYTHTGNTFNDNSTSGANLPQYTTVNGRTYQNWFGNSWGGLALNPYGLKTYASLPFTTILGNLTDINFEGGGPYTMANISSGQDVEVTISSETGANNAIVAGTVAQVGQLYPPVGYGLKVRILLQHTLQAGANTFSYNGTVYNIKSGFNAANNIATGYATGTMPEFEWVAGVFLDMRQ